MKMLKTSVTNNLISR